VDAVGKYRLGSHVSFYARMKDRTGRVVALDLDKGEALMLAQITQSRGTYKFYEYYVVDGKGAWLRRHTPNKLPKRWHAKLKSVAVNFSLILERWNRYDGWVPATSYPQGRKRPPPTRWVACSR
jgi:hypothetical protein